jgi:hypothetical protein
VRSKIAHKVSANRSSGRRADVFFFTSKVIVFLLNVRNESMVGRSHFRVRARSRHGSAHQKERIETQKRHTRASPHGSGADQIRKEE